MERNRTDAPPVALTTGEAARWLAVSPTTIRWLLARGAPVHVAAGPSTRVPTRSVDQLRAWSRVGRPTSAGHGRGKIAP